MSEVSKSNTMKRSTKSESPKKHGLVWMSQKTNCRWPFPNTTGSKKTIKAPWKLHSIYIYIHIHYYYHTTCCCVFVSFKLLISWFSLFEVLHANMHRFCALYMYHIYIDIPNPGSARCLFGHIFRSSTKLCCLVVARGTCWLVHENILYGFLKSDLGYSYTNYISREALK